MNGNAVETQGITRRFGDVVAVDGIDLTIPRGEIYGFLGPNGAGKTTVVRMLITLLMPTEGRALVAGFDVVNQPNDIRLRIGAALQDAALDPKQTGRELLRLQGRLYGLSRREVDTRLEELSSLVDIGDAIDRFIGTYSGGMKRRLDLAASLIHNPEVLFLDEPTTGLDPISRSRVWDEVTRINRELGVTIFLTTQYLEEADALAHRVGIINHGKLVAEGAPTDLKRSMGSDIIIARVNGQGELAQQALVNLESVSDTEVSGSEVLIQVSNGAASISDVALALAQHQVNVDEITLRTPTLDDVFQHFTGARMEEEAEPEQVQQ
ncbi:MAG: ATP-binding cassette domain-containing protein [SAR202 cluster bacterium]|nr:ATP-binding cassette domain-containing protein [SAR202 cluster bacterium]MDP6514291.1 ATP-binding cassette domain-containing protein [SAR202 cluster bacterium]